MSFSKVMLINAVLSLALGKETYNSSSSIVFIAGQDQLSLSKPLLTHHL